MFVFSMIQKHIYSMQNFMTVLMMATILGGCAYVLDGSTQEIKVVTPGAKGARCEVNVDNLLYNAFPPQSIIIPKSGADLIVDCLAPGNRRKQVVIAPSYADHAGTNVVNAGVGVAWDLASNALYQYPAIIEVNFTDTPPGPPQYPAQNSPDIRAPETYPLEEFKDDSPRLNEDRNKMPVEILRRQSLKFQNVSEQSLLESRLLEDNAVAQGSVNDLGNAIDPAAGQ